MAVTVSRQVVYYVIVSLRMVYYVWLSRQVVYHEATRIGCGQASCPQSIYKVFRACNYAIGSVLQCCTHRQHLSVSLSVCVSVSVCLSVCLSVSHARALCLHLQDRVSCDQCFVLFDLSDLQSPYKHEV